VSGTMKMAHSATAVIDEGRGEGVWEWGRNTRTRSFAKATRR